MLATPLFRVPPFPRARHRELMRAGSGQAGSFDEPQIDDIIALTRMKRVGGTYWGLQPVLPAKPYVLVRIRDPRARSKLLRSIGTDQRSILLWLEAGDDTGTKEGYEVVTGCCDPWHLLQGAERVYADASDELALLATIAGAPVRCMGTGSFEKLDENHSDPSALRQIMRDHILDPFDFQNPFDDEPISVAKAIDLCGFWRGLVDSNRGIGAALGFASWKRSTVEALLWAGSTPVSFNSPPDNQADGKFVAVWKSRVDKGKLDRLEGSGLQLVEVEDGFIRSVGLGADCVPPLSIVVDRLGIYFDPGRESDLEQLLQSAPFPEDLLARARQLREVIVNHGLSKYGSGGHQAEPIGSRPSSILVPGQVEDDRSVLCSEVRSNLELLRRVRADAPDAHIIYKPHPDVEAGHRAGKIADQLCLKFADEIVRDQPITALFNAVEIVAVNTSLAGFEALLRGKPVTTFGVPFYAGWGLTRDLGRVPERRNSRRTLDELVAAALLVYPRYVDPVTGIPCPPEVLVDRLSQGSSNQSQGMLVLLRRMQGRLRRLLSSFAPTLA